jgi:hypothetical protein
MPVDAGRAGPDEASRRGTIPRSGAVASSRCPTCRPLLQMHRVPPTTRPPRPCTAADEADVPEGDWHCWHCARDLQRPCPPVRPFVPPRHRRAHVMLASDGLCEIYYPARVVEERPGKIVLEHVGGSAVRAGAWGVGVGFFLRCRVGLHGGLRTADCGLRSRAREWGTTPAWGLGLMVEALHAVECKRHHECWAAASRTNPALLMHYVACVALAPAGVDKRPAPVAWHDRQGA